MIKKSYVVSNKINISYNNCKMISRKKSYITDNGNKKKSKFKLLRNRTIKNKYNLSRKKIYKKTGGAPTINKSLSNYALAKYRKTITETSKMSSFKAFWAKAGATLALATGAPIAASIDAVTNLFKAPIVGINALIDKAKLEEPEPKEIKTIGDIIKLSDENYTTEINVLINSIALRLDNKAKGIEEQTAEKDLDLSIDKITMINNQDPMYLSILLSLPKDIQKSMIGLFGSKQEEFFTTLKQLKDSFITTISEPVQASQSPAPQQQPQGSPITINLSSAMGLQQIESSQPPPVPPAPVPPASSSALPPQPPAAFVSPPPPALSSLYG